jgi:hypothetical protein
LIKSYLDIVIKTFIRRECSVNSINLFIKRRCEMAKNSKKLIGAWAFLIGVLVALVVGVVGDSLSSGLQIWVLGILVLAGILVGILNVNAKETSGFLLAALALVIVSFMGGSVIDSLGTVNIIGPILKNILLYLLVLFVPTTIIVALKSVFEIAKD